jgi:hypothetical protein
LYSGLIIDRNCCVFHSKRTPSQLRRCVSAYEAGRRMGLGYNHFDLF